MLGLSLAQIDLGEHRPRARRLAAVNTIEEVGGVALKGEVERLLVEELGRLVRRGGREGPGRREFGAEDD